MRARFVAAMVGCILFSTVLASAVYMLMSFCPDAQSPAASAEFDSRAAMRAINYNTGSADIVMTGILTSPK